MATLSGTHEQSHVIQPSVNSIMLNVSNFTSALFTAMREADY